MIEIDTDLNQIRLVRKLRADNLRKKQAALLASVQQATQKIQSSNLAYQDIESDSVQQQKQSLRDISTQGAVKAHRLVEYNKLQLKNIKRIKDALKEIEYAHSNHHKAKQNLNEGVKALNEAEKKLLKLDQIISGDIWR